MDAGMGKKNTALFFLIIILFLSQITGCVNSENPTNHVPSSTVHPGFDVGKTVPSPSEIPKIPVSEGIPTFTPENTAVKLLICSPIEHMTVADLKNAVITPFLPPPAGSDDPHHGIDLAVKDPVNGFALDGSAVNSILVGKVVGVIQDRFPYGNAVIIETPLQSLPKEWIEALAVHEIQPVDIRDSPLSCPTLEDTAISRRYEDLSFYILYAHLLNQPQFTPGEDVNCGQQIGQIGSTGNSINPHLHLETRVGMKNIQLGSMAHYDNSATLDEMRNYCLWRISGYFERMDPMILLEWISPG